MNDLRLTPRQRDVVQRVARGLANKEIANELGVSERAVKGHVSDLLQKFGVANRAGLIASIMTAQGLGLPRDVARPPSHPSLGDALAPSDIAAYEAAPIMVAVTLGPKHRYAFVNDMSARVARRAASSLVGRTLREAYPEFDPGYASALDAVYTTGVPWAATRSPARFVHEDGTSRDTFLHLMFAPLRDRASTIVGILHIGTEVEADDEPT
jgi:DNA-binding CsgD family transcriptional regulator